MKRFTHIIIGFFLFTVLPVWPMKKLKNDQKQQNDSLVINDKLDKVSYGKEIGLKAKSMELVKEKELLCRQSYKFDKDVFAKDGLAADRLRMLAKTIHTFFIFNKYLAKIGRAYYRVISPSYLKKTIQDLREREKNGNQVKGSDLFLKNLLFASDDCLPDERLYWKYMYRTGNYNSSKESKYKIEWSSNGVSKMILYCNDNDDVDKLFKEQKQLQDQSREIFNALCEIQKAREKRKDAENKKEKKTKKKKNCSLS